MVNVKYRQVQQVCLEGDLKQMQGTKKIGEHFYYYGMFLVMYFENLTCPLQRRTGHRGRETIQSLSSGLNPVKLRGTVRTRSALCSH